MLKINLNSLVPIYEQLFDELKKMIDHNVLKKGDSLPTIRALASQLDVANNTVARAYQELETKGLIKSDGRKGTIVASGKDFSNSEEGKIFKEPVRILLQKGFSRAEIEKIFQSTVALFFD